MIIYLIKATLCMGIFLLLYYIAFEGEKMYRFNRFYLIGSVCVALLIPFCLVDTQYVVYSEISGETSFDQMEEVYPVNSVDDSQSGWGIEKYAWGIYLMGFSLMAVRFFKGIWEMYILIRTSECLIKGENKIILHNESEEPFTFLQYIFLHRETYRSSTNTLLILHEQAHVKQGHSFDILFIEFIHCVLWFNPFLIYYKRAIKLNHEFLADEAVLDDLVEPESYMHLLIQSVQRGFEPKLASCLHYGQTKKRLNMMLKHKAKNQSIMKQLLIIPVLIGLILSFGKSKTIRIEQETKKVEEKKSIHLQDSNRQEILYDLDTFNGGMMAYRTGIGKTEKAKSARWVVAGIQAEQKVSFINEDGQEVVKLCKNLTQPERERFWKLPESKARYMTLPPEKNKPTQEQLKDFLDAKKYGVWLDGIRVENAVLKDTSPEDYHRYYSSRLAKNALNYGKHINQLNIYSQSNFEKEYAGKMNGWWVDIVLN